jgi:antirestriction protein ArdC
VITCRGEEIASSGDYAFEELVAELGAAFLCGELGVTNGPRLDHAAYLQSWLKILRDNKRAIFTAARLASAASEYLLALGAPRAA